MNISSLNGSTFYQAQSIYKNNLVSLGTGNGQGTATLQNVVDSVQISSTALALLQSARSAPGKTGTAVGTSTTSKTGTSPATTTATVAPKNSTATNATAGAAGAIRNTSRNTGTGLISPLVVGGKTSSSTSVASSSNSIRVTTLENQIKTLQLKITSLYAQALTDSNARKELDSKEAEMSTLKAQLNILQNL